MIEALRQRGLVAALLWDAPSPVVAVDGDLDFHGSETLVLVASSPVVVPPGRADTGVVTWDRAAAWASARADLPLAPPVTPARLTEIVAEAGRAGLALLEHDFARVRSLARSPLDRAVLSLVLDGARARAFVMSRAPKRRYRPENLRSARVARGVPGDGGGPPLVRAALAALSETPLPFKELLRRAREVIRASADDAAVLATALPGLAAEDRVVLSVS